MLERVVDTFLVPARIAGAVVETADVVRDRLVSLDGTVRRLLADLGPVNRNIEDIRLSVQPVPTLDVEIREVRVLVERLVFQLEKAVERLPDPNSTGPLDRAREVLTGKDPA
ncbi:MAG TPA: hypothetical protein VHJ37_10225 [Thermoleophilaceae bacterium]|jgi:hypothetical protein|nr:hypothetical protein [Thermoleophilaceae bacterium]